jgi:C4-dicarboxylate-specific signal transduction histidine kinase
MLTDVLHQNVDLKNLENFNNSHELLTTMINEINHPLAILGNYIHGCILRLRNEPHNIDEISHAMKQSAHQLKRISEINLNMKNFIHEEKLTHESVCIDTMITETIQLLYEEFNEYKLNVRYTKNKNVNCLHIHKYSIQQVILNLARNAIEAMQDAKTEDPKLTIEVNSSSKNFVEISVTDNGPGFSIQDKHKLFNLNFTTKSYGVGLGLAISRKIIELNGGAICIDSNSHYGACVIFSLPINKN